MQYLLSVLAILSLEVLVAALIWIWWQTLKVQQQQFHLKTKDTYAKLSQMVEETARESQAALTGALKTAESLEKDVEKQSQAMADHAQSLIKQQSEWQTATNQKLTEAFEATLSQETKAANQQLTTLLKEQTEQLTEEVRSNLKETQAALRSNLAADLQKAEKEVADYKQAEIERIHKAANSITQQIVTDFIGRDLTPSDHHQLVSSLLTKALANAKS